MEKLSVNADKQKRRKKFEKVNNLKFKIQRKLAIMTSLACGEATPDNF